MNTCIDCGSDKIENRDLNLCSSCGIARRKAEREASKVKAVKPIKKVSTKRAAENREYLKLRKEYLELYPVCEVIECHLKSAEIHHQKGRENGLLLDTNYFLAVCHDHHHMITVDSAWAIKNGYSVLRSTTQP